MVAKEGKDCFLTFDKLSYEDISKDTEIEVEKVKEIVKEMSNITLIDKTRYEKEGVIFIPQFVNYYDDYQKRVRRVFGENSDKIIKNRDEENKIEKNLIDLWNSTSLPKIYLFSSERKTHLRQRIKNRHFVENYSVAIEKISKSDFCLGGEDKKGWKSTIDWLLANDNNYVKALEGKYDNRSNGTALERFEVKKG